MTGQTLSNVANLDNQEIQSSTGAFQTTQTHNWRESTIRFISGKIGKLFSHPQKAPPRSHFRELSFGTEKARIISLRRGPDFLSTALAIHTTSLSLHL